MSNFTTKVLYIVKNIPKGRTLSYSEVARRAGNPRAARAVGTILKKNTDVQIPCHRVICSDGNLGAYNGLRGDKKTVLEKEGAVSH